MNNFTKAVKFQHPDYIPMQFHINASCWHHYPKEALWELMEEHKLLFSNFKRPAADWEPTERYQIKGRYYAMKNPAK